MRRIKDVALEDFKKIRYIFQEIVILQDQYVVVHVGKSEKDGFLIQENDQDCYVYVRELYILHIFGAHRI